MKGTIASVGIGIATIFGAVDASTLTETPLERVETIKNERVEVKQVGNVVETTMPWKGEQGIKIKVDMGEPTLTERLADKRKMEVVTEVLNENFKVDFLLNEKPDTNVFCQTIEGAENYDWFYQPPLTPEEIAEGAERPENVVGSYAIYHKTLANQRNELIPYTDQQALSGEDLAEMVSKGLIESFEYEEEGVGTTTRYRMVGINFETGKAFHVYRPQVWSLSSSSTKEWAELSFENNELCVTVPQKFLDSAEYPVRVDPTFGYTSLGNSQTFLIRTSAANTYNNRIGRGDTPDASGSVVRISVGMQVTTLAESSVDCSVFINTEDTGANSHVEVASAARTDVAFAAVSTPVFQFFDFSGSVTASTAYVLNTVCDWETVTTNSDVFIRYDSTATVNTYSEQFVGAGAYATAQEDPWTEDESALASNYSIYAIIQPTDAGTYTDTFYSGNHTWTAPTGVTSAQVACWGGGGGGFDDGTGSNGGAGGGGGAFASSTVALTPGNDYTITVATSSAESTPTIGKLSTFVADDKTVLACGGTGATSATANGVGGTTACSTGDVETAGGVGADAVTTDDTGGGGGGAGGPAGTGGAAANGQAATGGGGGGGNTGAASGVNGGTAVSPGGDGGAGVTTAYSAGTSDGKSGAYGGGGGGGGDNGTQGGNGGRPGGGGGGAEGNGGLGAEGQCTITYTAAGGAAAPVQQSELWF